MKLLIKNLSVRMSFCFRSLRPPRKRPPRLPLRSPRRLRPRRLRLPQQRNPRRRKSRPQRPPRQRPPQKLLKRHKSEKNPHIPSCHHPLCPTYNNNYQVLFLHVYNEILLYIESFSLFLWIFVDMNCICYRNFRNSTHFITKTCKSFYSDVRIKRD